jgi:hypothetical protein
MAPFIVYDLISENMNLFLAFIIGIGFGFALEQSGFSSSRKLAGMFYGYDTTVLKVFFTAAIVAMLGLLFSSLFGWVNLEYVYINPTFLTSAIVGGVIMGAGFIMGGFCPGTSFCAAAIGKIDAFVFIGAMLAGTFVFTEGYSIWERLYNAQYLGYPTVSELLGIAPGTLVFLIILAALGMFWMGEWAEKKFPREEY